MDNKQLTLMYIVVDCDLCRRTYEGMRHCPIHSATAVMAYYLVKL